MATNYSDRGFISLNGVPIYDVEDISWEVDDGTKVVPTMTRNRRNMGYVSGNRTVTCNFSIAVQNTLATPKIEFIDFTTQDVALTIQQGADNYTLVNMAFAKVTQSAPAVGTQGKKSFSALFLDIVDSAGNGDLFPTALKSILVTASGR